MTGIPARPRLRASARPARRTPRTTAGRLTCVFRAAARCHGALEGLAQALGEKVAGELALGERARVPAHLREVRPTCQRDQRLGERLAVAGGNVRARPVLLDEAAEPAVEVRDHRRSGRERVEELVRRVRLERLVGREDRQSDVGGGDDPGDLLARNRRRDDQVVQPELARAALEARPLASEAERDDPDPRLAGLLEGACSLGELVDAVRLPHRTRVERDELPVEPEPAEVLLAPCRPVEQLQLADVRDEDDLLGRERPRPRARRAPARCRRPPGRRRCRASAPATRPRRSRSGA